MKSSASLLRLLQYDDWANRETFASLRGTQLHRSRKILAHVISAEWLWFTRLKGEESDHLVWPEWTFEECEEQMNALQATWREYLSQLDGEQLAKEIAYTNTKGEDWRGTVEDVIMHVIIHSSYHRGQIAIDQRLSGQAPPFTDFAHCIRQGFVE